MAPGDLSTRKLRSAHGPGVYFAEPRSSWQQPSNKNTNCLFCKYPPKGDADHQPYLLSITERSVTAPAGAWDISTLASRSRDYLLGNLTVLPRLECTRHWRE